MIRKFLLAEWEKITAIIIAMSEAENVRDWTPQNQTWYKNEEKHGYYSFNDANSRMLPQQINKNVIQVIEIALMSTRVNDYKW